ncbi:hypothetical protein [Streptomyces sp. NPDC000134]|uniref:hypothetical protein n=1 Tax=Streptomyces sp. NPDC000134 TaxID=3364536 RepID=UPI00368E3178
MKRHRWVRTVLAAVTALLAACAAMLGPAAAAPAQEPSAGARTAREASPLAAIPPGLYRIYKANYHDCLAAGPQIDSATNDTALYMRGLGACTDFYSIWLVQPSSYGSQYTEVRSYAWNRCLEAEVNRNGVLTGIARLATCNGSSRQAFDFLGGTSSGRACVAASYYCRKVLYLSLGFLPGQVSAWLARMVDPVDDSEYEYPQQRWEMVPVPLG